jgi:hypothetical protein
MELCGRTGTAKEPWHRLFGTSAIRKTSRQTLSSNPGNYFARVIKTSSVRSSSWGTEKKHDRCPPDGAYLEVRFETEAAPIVALLLTFGRNRRIPSDVRQEPLLSCLVTARPTFCRERSTFSF